LRWSIKRSVIVDFQLPIADLDSLAAGPKC